MEEKRYHCPVQATVDIIGGKWKCVILYYLLEGGTLRFGELRRRMPDLTPKMLTQQLRELEHDGVLARRVYAEVPPRVEYSLTAFGRSLEPIIRLMLDWGIAYLRQRRAARAVAPAAEGGNRQASDSMAPAGPRSAREAEPVSPS